MLGLRDFNSGGYSFNLKMAAALSDAGHNVDVVHFTTVPVAVKGSRVRGSFHVLARVLKHNPDLVIVSKSYSFMVPLRVLLYLLRYPVLYLVHHLEWHDRSGAVSTGRKKLIRWLVSAGNRVWVNSSSTSDDVVALGIPPGKLRIIAPGFHRFEISSGSVFKDDGVVRILSVGTVCSRKDQLTLVRACAMLGDRNYKLLILGDETSDPEYSSLVRKEGRQLGKRLVFMGHLPTEDLHRLYNQSHVLANLSRWEGYGIAVVEALWAGLPVVAVNAGAVPELVTHGENGYLTEPGDAEGCAEFLRKLIDNRKLREEMSERAHAGACSLYTWQDTGREFVKLAEETAGGKIRRNQSG